MVFIDISAYQGVIDWARVRKSGVTAAYLKATEGTTWNDPNFLANRKAANAQGIHVGAYHFAHLGDPAKEAAHFLSVVKNVGPKDLKPALDLETYPKDGRPMTSRNFAVKFNQAVHAKTGVYPMFYSYGPLITWMQFSKPIGNGLWIAAYGRNDGREYPVFAPKPWKNYVAHQFTSRGTTPGIRGYVDLSVSPRGLTPLLAHPVRNTLSNF